METWKSIKEYESKYEVSNFGRIRSLDKKDSIGRNIKGKIMNPIKRKDGYLQIFLHKNGQSKQFLIHRLVAQAFIPNPNNLLEVNHKDENKQNNNVDNLEWCNRSYNVNFGTGNKNRRKTLLNKRGKKIIQYDKNNNIVKIYPSLMQVVRELKLCQSHISQCCNGVRNTAYGYRWKYI